MHPNGQLPAYEWAFGDVNPPVHAWAAWRVYKIDREQRGGHGDRTFLERVFHKLLLNFTWWVNRKDVEGRNIFQGGFLGLDNIGDFRPQRAAADRRHDRSVRRHRLDGDVRARHDAHRAGAGARRSRLRRHRLQVLRAFSLHRRGDEQYRRRRHRACGTRRTVLLRCPAPPRRRADPAAAALDGRADPAVRGRGARRLGVRPAARLQRPNALVSRAPPAPRPAGLALARRQRRRAASACLCCAGTG